MQVSLRRHGALAIALGFVACAKSVQAPSASASAAATTVNIGTIVQLDSQGSSDPQGRQLTYDWSILQQPPGSAATLNNAHSVNPSFIADVAGKILVQLVVANSLLSSQPSQLMITVVDCGANPPVIGSLTATTQGLGVGVSFNPGQVVNLSAAVTDADSACNPPFPETFSYAWTLLARPAASAAFIVPNSDGTLASVKPDLPGPYLVQLVVTDSTGRKSAPAFFSFTTTNCGTGAPTIVSVTAPSSRVPVNESSPGATTSVTLTAKAFDANDVAGGNCGSTPNAYNSATKGVTFTWTLASAPAGSAAATPSTQPATALDGTSALTFAVDRAGTFVWSVVATDLASGLSSAASTISVPTGPCGPAITTIDSTSLSSGVVGTQTTFSSHTASPVDNCVANAIVTFSWSLLSRPATSAANINASAGTLTPDVPGTYLVQLLAQDQGGFSSTVTTTYTATGCQAAPTAAFASTPFTVTPAALTDPAGTFAADRINFNAPTITTNGCGVPAAQTISYSWTLVSKPASSAAVLAGANTATPTFVADVPGDGTNPTYQVSLTVTNGQGLSSAPIIQPVVVSACGSQPPVPSIAGGGSVNTFASLSLTAMATALDNISACPTRLFDIALSFSWSIVSTPPGGKALLSATSQSCSLTGTPPATACSPSAITFSPQAPGAYGVQLAATGSNGVTASMTRIIMSNPCGSYAPAALTVCSNLSMLTGSCTGTLTNAFTASQTFNGLTSTTAPFNTNVPIQITANVVDLDNLPTSQSTSFGAGCGITPFEALSASWTLVGVPAGSQAKLVAANSVTPGFTPDKAGTYTLQLVSSDSTGASTTQQFAVTSDACGASPPTVGTASALSLTQMVVPGGQTVCSGTTSTVPGVTCTVVNSSLFDVNYTVQVSDPSLSDTQPSCTRPFSQPQTFAWSFASVPPGSRAVLNNASTSTPSFMPDVTGNYTLALTVTDATTLSTSQTFNAINAVCGAAAPVAVDTATDGAVEAKQTVPSVNNTALAIVESSSTSKPAPLFPATNNGQFLYQGVPVQLVVASVAETDSIASCAAVAPPLPAISYRWSFAKLPVGSNARLNFPTVQNPSFTPDANGEYDVTLQLTDAFGRSTSTTYTFVQVGLCGGQGPTAAIAWQQGQGVAKNQATVGTTATVLLDGTSGDPDKAFRTGVNAGCGLPVNLTYSWAFTSLPVGTSAKFSNASVINPTFVPDKSGAYGVSLLVSDGTRSSIANAMLTAAPWFAANNASAPSTSALTVNRLRVDSTNSNVWAATSSGVWQSTNGGANWVQPAGAPTTGVFAGLSIAYRGSSTPFVYASFTGCGTNYYKFDGSTWTGNTGAACFIQAVAADPTDTTGQTAVFAFKNGPAAVGVTTTGGAYNASLNNGLGTDNQISAAAVTANGSVLIGSDGTATNGGRIYRLPNVAAVQGAGPPTPTTTWTTVLNLNAGAGGTINALYADPTTGPTTGTVLAAIADGRVFQSTDHGATWTQRVAAGSAAAFDVYLDGSGNGFAAIGQGIFRSTSSGATWSAASSGLPAANITAVALDPRTPVVGYAGAAGLGFFATFSGGQ